MGIYDDNYRIFETTMNLEEPDRVPRWDIINNEQLWKQFGGTGDPLEVCAKAHRGIGLDVSRYSFYYSDFNWIKHKMAEFTKFMGINRAQWEIITKAGTSSISKRPFTDLEGLRNNLPQYPDEDVLAEWLIPFYKKTREAYKREGVVFVANLEGPLTESYLFAGLDLFAMAIYMDPKAVDHLLDVFEKFGIIQARIWAEYDFGPAFFVADDIAFGSGLMFSEKWLKKHLFPRLKRIMAPLKKKGIKVVYHSDGNLYSILDYLVNELKIDALNPIDPSGGMDIQVVKRKWGDRIALVGNVDCTGILSTGTPHEVAMVTKKTIEVAAPGGGLVIGSSSELHDSVPVQNALALHQTAKKYGQYPIHQ